MSERMFTVLVPQPGKPAMAYPPQTGDKALASMKALKTRGHDPIARTTANGITSDLSLEDMADTDAERLNDYVVAFEVGRLVSRGAINDGTFDGQRLSASKHALSTPNEDVVSECLRWWDDAIKSGLLVERNLSNYIEQENESIQDVADDVLERAKKYGFKPDEDMVRGAVEESANLLNIELTEPQITEACQRVMNPRDVSKCTDRLPSRSYGHTAYEVTVEDVEVVLSSNALAVANTDGKSFEAMAEELHGDLDFDLIEQAALAGDDLDEQTGYANDEIARQLREMGVLEPLKQAYDSPSPGM